jgi:hypothetical protein
MNLAIAIAASLLITGTAAARDTYVKPHYRSDGTYVPGHYRTAPNNTTTDNYSTSPNYNPYTGKQGTVERSAPPGVSQYQPYQYAPPRPPAPIKPYTPYIPR